MLHGMPTGPNGLIQFRFLRELRELADHNIWRSDVNNIIVRAAAAKNDHRNETEALK
jgi:hypothetical protein